MIKDLVEEAIDLNYETYQNTKVTHVKVRSRCIDLALCAVRDMLR